MKHIGYVVTVQTFFNIQFNIGGIGKCRQKFRRKFRQIWVCSLFNKINYITYGTYNDLGHIRKVIERSNSVGYYINF